MLVHAGTEALYPDIDCHSDFPSPYQNVDQPLGPNWSRHMVGGVEEAAERVKLMYLRALVVRSWSCMLSIHDQSSSTWSIQLQCIGRPARQHMHRINWSNRQILIKNLHEIMNTHCISINKEFASKGRMRRHFWSQSIVFFDNLLFLCFHITVTLSVTKMDISK